MILAFIFQTSFAQKDSCLINLNGCFLRNAQGYKKGQQFNYLKLKYQPSIENPSYYLETKEGDKFYVSSSIEKNIKFDYRSIQELCDAKIITNVIYNKDKKGAQTELRNEMEDEALDYINKVKNYNLELNDPYLYDYIYSLLLKMSPLHYIDGRRYDLNVLIKQSPDINARIYPNGTLVINTGLLSILHSEDELVAVLAHELGHFILDHSVINVNKAEARKKRAAFWAAVATGVTAVAEGIAASNNHYYTPGLGTLAMAILATEISQQVVEHLGMKFNHEQENEADLFALSVLKILGYNKNALATALNKMGEICAYEDKYGMFFESYTHPDLRTRIQNTGSIVNLRNVEYEQKISFAISNVAMIKFINRRFSDCMPFVSQNIENNVANADDYILKANCILATRNNNESNNEVAALISKAKEIEPDNINVYKSEIMLSFRLHDINKSIILLENYYDILNSMDKFSSFVIEELKWSKHMLIKLKGMKGSKVA